MSQIIKKFIGNDQVDGDKIRLDNDQSIRARNAADSADVEILKLSGTDKVDFNANTLTNIGAPSGPNDAATKDYTDTQGANYINKDGSVDFTGDQSLGGNLLTNVADPVSDQDAATKAYVDSQASNGANKTLSNLDSPTAINQDLLPDDDNTWDLGSPSSRWTWGYITAIDAGVVELSLDGSDINVNSNQIHNLSDPSSAQDAATKAYVDAVAQGLKPKAAVRVGTVADINLSSMPAAVDGVTLSSGNRVLVKDQATPSENGIYIFNGAASAATRAPDFDSLTPIDEINGAYTFIQEGTQAGQGWVETGTVTTIGTDPINFVYFNDLSGLIGGDMITVVGSTISVDLATVSGLESTNPGNSSGQLRIKLEASNPTLQTNGSNELGAKLDAAGAIITGSSGLKVQPDAVTTKINGSNQVESLKETEQLITLSGTDITNQYVDLSHAAYGTSASVNSVSLTPVGGILQQKTVDYTVSLTGGSGGVTRVSFSGDLATGGASELVAGDKLAIRYSFLT